MNLNIRNIILTLETANLIKNKTNMDNEWKEFDYKVLLSFMIIGLTGNFMVLLWILLKFKQNSPNLSAKLKFLIIFILIFDSIYLITSFLLQNMMSFNLNLNYIEFKLLIIVFLANLSSCLSTWTLGLFNFTQNRYDSKRETNKLNNKNTSITSSTTRSSLLSSGKKKKSIFILCLFVILLIIFHSHILFYNFFIFNLSSYSSSNLSNDSFNLVTLVKCSFERNNFILSYTCDIYPWLYFMIYSFLPCFLNLFIFFYHLKTNFKIFQFCGFDKNRHSTRLVALQTGMLILILGLTLPYSICFLYEKLIERHLSGSFVFKIFFYTSFTQHYCKIFIYLTCFLAKKFKNNESMGIICSKDDTAVVVKQETNGTRVNKPVPKRDIPVPTPSNAKSNELSTSKPIFQERYVNLESNKFKLDENPGHIYLGGDTPSVVPQVDNLADTTPEAAFYLGIEPTQIRKTFTDSTADKRLFQERYLELDANKFASEENPGEVYLGVPLPKKALFQERYIRIDPNKFEIENNPGNIFMG